MSLKDQDARKICLDIEQYLYLCYCVIEVYCTRVDCLQSSSWFDEVA